MIVDDEKWDVDSDSDAVKDYLDFVSVGDSIIQHLDPQTIVPGKSVNICLRGKSTTEVNARLKEEFKSNKPTRGVSQRPTVFLTKKLSKYRLKRPKYIVLGDP